MRRVPPADIGASAALRTHPAPRGRGRGERLSGHAQRRRLWISAGQAKLIGDGCGSSGTRYPPPALVGRTRDSPSSLCTQ